MIQTLHSRPPSNAPLRAAVLEEIVGSHAAQLAVEELGLAMATHPGSKRDRNEDRIAVARIVAPDAETYTVVLVCDGVGGSQSGDEAAALAITSIIVNLSQQRGRPSLKELAVALVRQADDDVRSELQGRGATTLAMLLATGAGYLVCANVGDSRVYSWDPNSHKLDQVTIDDTIENELKNLPGNAAGLIEARGLQGRLSQALGEGGRTADELRVQTYTKERFRFGAVLGSDGLWRAASDFEAAVANAATPTDAVRRAIALANWVGGVDNASLIAIASVEQLCGKLDTNAPPAREQSQIVLWSSSAKVKFLMSPRSNDDKPAQVRSKAEKQKKNTKKKVDGANEEESQLALRAVGPKVARPKVEVTVSEEPEKGSELARR